MYVHDGEVTDATTYHQWLRSLGRPLDVVYRLKDEETLPINPTDLTYLRSLENLKGGHLIITDQNGNDVSYLVEYIRHLSEV